MTDTPDHLSPEACHDPLLDRAPRILAFDPDAYLPEWQSAARRSFKQLLGSMPAKPPLNLRITADTQTPIAREIHFTFTAELNADIPAVILIPNNAAVPVPVIICMQGHRGTLNASLGRPANPMEQEAVSDHKDFAIHAVNQGYAALAFDMRNFGARANPGQPTCQHAAMTALLLGRTLIGERVFDITRAIDALETFSEIDRNRIACMGHSGGGTAAFYAAAIDPRIAGVLLSACVCTYRDSIAAIDHCACNYLPGILHYFDFADLAGLIAPRPLAIIHGQSDPIFPIQGTEKCLAEIRAIYAAQKAESKLAVALFPGGHDFIPQAAWTALAQCTGWRVVPSPASRPDRIPAA